MAPVTPTGWGSSGLTKRYAPSMSIYVITTGSTPTFQAGLSTCETNPPLKFDVTPVSHDAPVIACRATASLEAPCGAYPAALSLSGSTRSVSPLTASLEAPVVLAVSGAADRADFLLCSHSILNQARPPLERRGRGSTYALKSKSQKTALFSGVR